MPDLIQYDGLSAEQQSFVDLMSSDKCVTMSWAAIADHVGVNVRTLYRWRRDPQLVRLVNDNHKARLEQFRPEADAILMDLCKQGNIRALETYYKHIGCYSSVSDSSGTQTPKIEIRIESAPIPQHLKSAHPSVDIQ